MSNPWSVAAVIAPVAATLVSAFIDISRPQMWRDELATWSATHRSPGQLWHLMHHQDAVHGFYYLFLHYWTVVFGDSPLAMRAPSALATAVTAGCVALLGRRIGGDKLAVTAGLLYALLPVTTRYAQEARSYALMTAAVMVATLLLDRAIETGARKTWVAYTLVLALVGAFNLVALTILVGHAVYVARRSPSMQTWRAFVGSVSAVAIVLAPLIYAGSTQRNQLSWIPRPRITDLVHVGPQLFATSIGAGAILILAVAAWSQAPAQRYPLIPLAVLPAVAIWLMSQEGTHYFLARYLLFTTPIWALAAARALTAGRPTRILAVLLVLLVLVWPDQKAIRTPTSHEAVIYSGAADVIARDARPGDAIVFARSPHTLVDIGVRYYLTEHPRRHAPADVWLGQRGADTGQLLDTNTTDTTLESINSYTRVWLVVPGSPADPLATLNSNARAGLGAFHISDRHNYQGLTLTLLVHT